MHICIFNYLCFILQLPVAVYESVIDLINGEVKQLLYFYIFSIGPSISVKLSVIFVV